MLSEKVGQIRQSQDKQRLTVDQRQAHVSSKQSIVQNRQHTIAKLQAELERESTELRQEQDELVAVEVQLQADNTVLLALQTDEKQKTAECMSIQARADLVKENLQKEIELQERLNRD